MIKVLDAGRSQVWKNSHQNTLLMLNVVVIPFCAALLGRYAAEGYIKRSYSI